MSSVAQSLERAWQSPPRWLLLLLPLEWSFAGLASLRRLAFRRGWLRRHHPGVPVIVVGNLSVGGTGKTPVVIELARSLHQRGLKVAVISRGYGGSQKSPALVTEHSTAEKVGDEALLVSLSTEAQVYVGADRAAVADLAAEDGAGVIISDDGLQHYALVRDLEIVVVDASMGFGNGHLLPLGPLRESPRRLATVDFVLQRGGSDPHSALRYVPRNWRRLRGTEERSLSDAGFGPEVHALAGIARPERFFDALRELDLEPLEHAVGDHQRPTAALLRSLADRPLVMTTKDEVKCPAIDHPDAWVLEMELQFPQDFTAQVLDRLQRKGVNL